MEGIEASRDESEQEAKVMAAERGNQRVSTHVPAQFSFMLPRCTVQLRAGDGLLKTHVPQPSSCL